MRKVIPILLVMAAVACSPKYFIRGNLAPDFNKARTYKTAILPFLVRGETGEPNSTLRDRAYVDIEGRRFTATDIGKIVSRFLTQYFTTYVDYDFTAKMEDSLDAVASGEQEWVPLLEKFWKPFIDLVKHTETSVSREEVATAMAPATRSASRVAQVSTMCPPSDPPITPNSRRMPRWSSTATIAPRCMNW